MMTSDDRTKIIIEISDKFHHEIKPKWRSEEDFDKEGDKWLNNIENEHEDEQIHATAIKMLWKAKRYYVSVNKNKPDVNPSAKKKGWIWTPAGVGFAGLILFSFATSNILVGTTIGFILFIFFYFRNPERWLINMSISSAGAMIASVIWNNSIDFTKNSKEFFLSLSLKPVPVLIVVLLAIFSLACAIIQLRMNSK